TGTFVGGDLLLALFARKEVRSGLVVPVDASMVLEDLLPKAKVWRTRVGDVYVAAELKRRGADFGGEPSGTWIFPKATLCPDGVYAAARLVTIVAARPLDAMVQEIPRYPVLRGSVTYDPSKRNTIESRLDAALRDLGGRASHFSDIHWRRCVRRASHKWPSSSAGKAIESERASGTARRSVSRSHTRNRRSVSAPPMRSDACGPTSPAPSSA